MDESCFVVSTILAIGLVVGKGALYGPESCKKSDCLNLVFCHSLVTLFNFIKKKVTNQSCSQNRALLGCKKIETKI